VKPVEQRPSRCIGQRFEDVIHGRHHMQPNGCMSRWCFGAAFCCATVAADQQRLVLKTWVEKKA
jgi:hypothetical protein